MALDLLVSLKNTGEIVGEQKRYQKMAHLKFQVDIWKHSCGRMFITNGSLRQIPLGLAIFINDNQDIGIPQVPRLGYGSEKHIKYLDKKTDVNTIILSWFYQLRTGVIFRV